MAYNINTKLDSSFYEHWYKPYTEFDMVGPNLIKLPSYYSFDLDKVRKQVREMSERNILLVMIIVEGKQGKRLKEKDSIIHMKEVAFEKGKPKIKHFIDDYPFPYYLVLEDMNSLPEILGDALRQWFEMLAQIQSSTT